MSEINTGIIVNNKPVFSGDTLLFENIGNDAIVSALADRLERGILDAIVIHFYKYTDGLNMWSIILIPLKNNKPLTIGEYFEVNPEEYSEKTEVRYNSEYIELYEEPKVHFIHDLLRNTKNISFTNDFDVYLKEKLKNILAFTSWKF